MAENRTCAPQLRQNPRRRHRDIRRAHAHFRRPEHRENRAFGNPRPQIPQSRPRQRCYRQIPKRPARRAERRHRRHHHQLRVRAAHHAQTHPHHLFGVFRHRRQRHPFHRRNPRLSARPRKRATGRLGTPRLALCARRRLRHQSGGQRPPQNGADRRHRQRRRSRRNRSGRPHREAGAGARRRRLYRRYPRGTQNLLARPQPHRRHRQTHQRLQNQRRRGDSVGTLGRVFRWHRTHQHRIVDQKQTRPLRSADPIPARQSAR